MTDIKNHNFRPLDAPLFFDDFVVQKKWRMLHQQPPAQIAPLPATNLTEYPNSYVVELIAPGIPLEALEILTTDTVLDIKFVHSSGLFEPMSSRRSWHKEYSLLPFQRRFELNPDMADILNLTVQNNNGVFKFIIPKKERFLGKVTPEMPFSLN